MSLISFTSNYNDKSTEHGYQFEFNCDNCGNGYTSHFQESKLGMAGGFLRAAGGMLGHFGSEAAHGAHEVNDMMRGKNRDNALREAVEEAKKVFKQCSRCGRWVCPEVCWNAQRNQCVKCAPDFAKEAQAAQATGMKEQLWRDARDTDTMRRAMGGFDLGAPNVAGAACAACGAAGQKGKFCTECGKPIATKVFCGGCGSEAASGAKFCTNCGGKLG